MLQTVQIRAGVEGSVTKTSKLVCVYIALAAKRNGGSGANALAARSVIRRRQESKVKFLRKRAGKSVISQSGGTSAVHGTGV